MQPKMKRLMEKTEGDVRRQFYPVTHWNALEGIPEYFNETSDINFNKLLTQQEAITNVVFPFKNQTFAALGDSTTFGTKINGVVYSWTPYIKKLTQVNSVENYGYSGSMITLKEGVNTSFVERCVSIRDKKCISIFGGVNDFNYNSILGTLDENSSSTFFGALKNIIITLTNNNPEAKLFFITPMKTNNVHDTFQKNELGLTLLNYVDAIKKVADYYSIPVLDFYSYSNVSPYNPTQKALYMHDGTHLNEKGQQRIATQISSFINKL